MPPHQRIARRTIALAAASLVVAAGALALPPAPALGAVSKANQLTDVSPDHWAYGAIRSLIEKYRGILGGYPDYTFRGNRPVSRYELAASLAKIMDRLEPLNTDAVMPQDQATIARLKKEFAPELAELDKRVTALEGSIKALTEQVAIIDHVHGNISTTLEDDPQDQYFPFLSGNLSLKFAGKLDPHVSYTASLTGGLPAIQTGNTPPALARLEANEEGYDPSDKGAPPDKAIRIDDGAGMRVDVQYPEFSGFFVKSGYFKPSENIGTGGFATHFGDGVLGSGLHRPKGSSVRSGAADIGVMSGVNLGGLGLTAALTSKMVIGQVVLDAGPLDLRVLGDVDHNSVGNVTIKGDQVYNVAAYANLGSSDLGISVGGGLKQQVPLGQVTANASLFGAQIAGGVQFTSLQGVQEAWPTGYIFIPLASGSTAPSILVAAHEPLTVTAGPDPQTGQQRAGGNGSYLGHKSGLTVQVAIPNTLIPDLKLEYDYKANVLFGPTYDAQGYAVSTDLDF